jgi:hypothetical protein
MPQSITHRNHAALGALLAADLNRPLKKKRRAPLGTSHFQFLGQRRRPTITSSGLLAIHAENACHELEIGLVGRQLGFVCSTSRERRYGAGIDDSSLRLQIGIGCHQHLRLEALLHGSQRSRSASGWQRGAGTSVRKVRTIAGLQ